MQPNKIIGIVVTVAFHVALLLILLFCGFEIPYPPPGEQGILISFGNTTTGRGIAEPMRQQPVTPRPQPQAAQKDDEENMTQDYEDAPAIEQKKKARKRRRTPTNSRTHDNQPAEQPIPSDEPKPTEKPREVNRNALFPGNNNASTQGEGNVTGGGNQGSPEGSPNSPNARGSAFGDVNGVSLNGRSLRGALPTPDYNIQQSGRVIVRIKVDRDGNVIEAKAQQEGSTLMDATLYDAAERAALRAKFSASSTAAVNQWGTITYVFKLGQ